MREIKFRGKTIKGGQWIQGDLFRAGTDPSDGEFAISYWDEESGWMSENVQSNTVGQFTGLLDKDGREIYEGDIVTNRVHNYQVSYETSHTAAFVCKYKGRIAGCLGQLYAFEPQYITVVGNIHDTPELLNTR